MTKEDNKKRKNKHIFSTYALMGIIFILLAGGAIAISSAEIDELCNTTDSYLFRNSTVWGCGSVPAIPNLTLQQVTDNGATTTNDVSVNKLITDTIEGSKTPGVLVDDDLTVDGDAETQFLEINTPAISGRELLMKARVTDGGYDQFGIAQGTALSGEFAPTFYAFKNSDQTPYVMNFRAMTDSANDVVYNDFGMLNFEFYRSGQTDPNNQISGGIVNRALFSITNGLSTATRQKLLMEATGDIHVNNFENYNSAFDMAIGIKRDTSEITGLDFYNDNEEGQTRFMARSDDRSYLVMNAPNSQTTGQWFNTDRDSTHYIWTAGSVPRQLAIGTIFSENFTLGTNDTKAIVIDGNTQDVEIQKNLWLYNNISNNRGRIYQTQYGQTGISTDSFFIDVTEDYFILLQNGLLQLNGLTVEMGDHEGSNNETELILNDALAQIEMTLDNFKLNDRNGRDAFLVDVPNGLISMGDLAGDLEETKIEINSEDGEISLSDGTVTINDLAGSYTGGSAFVCVYSNGELYASETACP